MIDDRIFGYSDDGERVPVVLPSVPGDDRQPGADADARADAPEVLRRLIDWLDDGKADAAEIGQRVILLAHVLRPGAAQWRLALRLGVSEPTCSRMLKQLSADLRHLAPNRERPGA